MDSIWEEEDEYYTLPALTEKMVTEAEKKLGITLPESYITILKEQNGGRIIFDAFSISEDESIYVDHILGIGEEGILQTEYLIKEWGLPDGIVLLSGDGHSWVAFDYREVKVDPAIIYIDIELERMIEIAPDFASFISGLYVEEEESDEFLEDQINREWNLESLKAALHAVDEQEVSLALEFLYDNPTGHEMLIEESLIHLLKSDVLEIKQLTANFAHHFHELEVLSREAVNEIIAVMKRDEEIAYYVEMFFSE